MNANSGKFSFIFFSLIHSFLLICCGFISSVDLLNEVAVFVHFRLFLAFFCVVNQLKLRHFFMGFWGKSLGQRV